MAAAEHPEHEPRRPGGRHRAVLVALALLFALQVALRLHGFSLPIWHEAIDGSPAPEVLLGTPRTIRVDDWAVHLPLALAQGAHDPPFPVVNRDVGAGQNMLVPFPLPVAHPATLFRPTLWGFFAGPDLGLAWMWGVRAAGFLAAWFLLLRRVTRGRTGLALSGAALLFASPFVQFWSLNAAPVATWAALAGLALVGMTDTRGRARWAWGLALGWAGAAFVLAIYPPYQIVLGWLALFLAAGLVAEARAWRALPGGAAARAGPLLLAVAIVAGATLAFLLSAHEAIARLADTVYPGRRVAAGGALPLWQILNANLGVPLQVETEWGALRNLCESASFALFAPALAVAFLLEGLRRRRLDPVAVSLLVYVALLTAWCALGLPGPLAAATGLDQVPGPRAVLGIGLADGLLLMRFLAVGSEGTGESRDRPGHAAAAAAALAFAALLAWAAWRLAAELPETRPALLAGLVAANAGAAWAALRRLRPELLVAALAAGVAVSTLWFNPVVRGGSDFLRDNPLSRRILALDAEAGGRSVWVAYDAFYLANLPRMLGVRSLTGHYAVPQPELWEIFDPEGAHRDATNRYAFVWAERRTEPETGFERRAVDAFVLRANPLDPELRRAGATHVLYVDEAPGAADRFPELDHVGSVGWTHLFRIPEPRR